MRWVDLFRDLEAQFERADAAELAAEVADRTRSEAAQLRLVDRLLPVVGRPVRLHVYGAGHVAGRLEHVGVEAVLIVEPSAREALVPLAAVLGVLGVSAWSAPAAAQGEVFQRLGLRAAVRCVAKDRAQVRVVLRDSAVVTGTIDRVGADFVEVAEHAPGEARRRDQVRDVRVIPLRAIATIFST